MLKAHKVALDPTNKQATLLAKSAGTARFAYNWALARWQEQYQAAKRDPAAVKPSQLSLRRELNSVKKTEFPWMGEVTKCAPQEAIINLGPHFRRSLQTGRNTRGLRNVACTTRSKSPPDSSPWTATGCACHGSGGCGCTRVTGSRKPRRCR